MMNIETALKKVFGSANDRILKRMQPVVSSVGSLEPKFQALSDEQLKACTPDFKQRIEN
ncbi:MAG: hypothetical protein VX519_07715, partial [Myxococcota bacterium]|nr:hypothetical protein [Myxococcota bacterium]